MSDVNETIRDIADALNTLNTHLLALCNRVAVEPIERSETPVPEPPASPATPPAPQAPSVPTTAPEPSTAPDVDSEGVTWDARIHAGNKATRKDGTWRRKRGINDDQYNEALAEITGRAASPAPSTPPAPTEPQNAPKPPSAPAAPPPPPEDPQASSAAAKKRNDIAVRVIELTKKPGGMDLLAEKLTGFGVGSVSEIPEKHLDLFSQHVDHMEAVLAGGGQ